MRSKSNSRFLNENSYASSISNKYIKEMISNEGLNLKTYKDLIGEKKEKKEKFLNNSEKLVYSTPSPTSNLKILIFS